MQSAAVPCTGNGIKRTAANALSSSSSPPTSSSNQNDHSNHTQSDSPPPPEKRSFIVVESPIKLETISSAEDLDIKVLRIQNKNLSERLVQRQKLESELRDKIDKLQNRKASDDSKLCIIDRYWTQLDEDLRLMLERFDSNDSSKDSNSSDINSTSKSSSSKTNKENLGLKGSSQPVRNFLAKLNDWDKSEVDDSLKERVKFTTQTVSKLITIYDRLVKKNDLYFKELTSQNSNITQESMDTSSNNSGSNEKKLKELYEENVKLNDLITVCQQKIHSNGIEKKELEDKIALLENELKELNTKSDETEYELDKIRDKAFKLDRQLADTLTKLNNIQKQTNLSTTNHVNHIDQNGHIVYHNNLNQSTANSSNNNNNNNRTNNISDKQISDLEFELEQQKELASNRLHELEKLNQEFLTSNKQIEKLKADLKTIPESVIEQTSEYRMLQTKYSLIVNDNIKLKQALDETRSILETSRITFQRQLEQMESEELAQQKRLGNEMMQIEEQLAQVRKENELLRIEYEQNLAANEQTGPINKEMRSLITTLQTNNKLLKSDNIRTKKRLEEAQQEIERLKNKSTQLQTQLQQLNAKNSSSDIIKTENSSCNNQTTTECSMNNLKTEPPDMSNCTNIKTESLDIDVNRENDESKDSIIKDLKEKNRKLQENQKDIKNIIDIYSKTTNSSSNSNSSSSSNSSVSSSSSSSNSTSKEKKYLNELEEAKIEIKRLKECLEKLKSTSTSSSQNTTPSSSSSRLIIPTQQIPSNSPSTSNHTPSSTRYHHNKTEHHHSDESCNTPNSSTPNQSSSSSDLTKKIKSLEETVKELQKSLSNKKQEESALLTDMEITGQAFEDMQEQNIRLMQQLREKDDANFKLVSERIKLENVQKILKEEKDIFSQQVLTLQEQQEVQMNVSKKLEEQIQLLTQSIAILEKEVIQLQQTCETYKRQAIDNVQLIQELKLNSQKYLLQLKEAQQQIAEKSDLLASHTFTNKRTQEEIKHLQSKLERQKKFEMAANMDEVLKEEIKEYKEQLRCPSCKIKQKDAVLTKCFHVFCFDCLQKRYESRQRKCPKCNAGFGANDYRKLYLS